MVSSSEDEHVTLSMIRAGLGYGVVEKELAQHWAKLNPVAAIIEMTRRLWQESVELEAAVDAINR